MDRAIVIVVPVYLQEDAAKVKVLKRIFCSLSKIGKVLVVNQGARITYKNENVSIFHSAVPLGIWGAIRVASQIVEKSFKYEIVAINSAPLYFLPKTVARLLAGTMENPTFRQYGHSVAARKNIALSLEDGTGVGIKRALLECFLTTLAGIIELDRPDFSKDGFSGLRIFSEERFLKFDWSFVDRTNWGGELESQLQSARMGNEILFIPIKPKVVRRWQTTLGNSWQDVIVTMIDRVRGLNFLKNPPSQENIVRALDSFPEIFGNQPWLNPATAVKGVLEMLRFYNERHGQFFRV